MLDATICKTKVVEPQQADHMTSRGLELTQCIISRMFSTLVFAYIIIMELRRTMKEIPVRLKQIRSFCV